jgi:cold shock protein
VRSDLLALRATVMLGALSPDEGGEDLFVHYTGIAGTGFRTLEEGERVSYEPTRGKKGEQAENVRKV